MEGEVSSGEARAQSVLVPRDEDSGRLLRDVPVAVFRTTLSGDVLEANPAFLEVFGYRDINGVNARPIADLYVQPGERAGLVARLKAEGRVTDFECRMRRADGSEFWFSRAAHVVHRADGSIQIESFGVDVTKRKVAELELAESEARLRGLLIDAPVGVVTVDLDGTFTFAGGSVFEQLGIDAEALVGRDVSSVYPDRPDLVELFSAAKGADAQTDLQVGERSIHIRVGPYRLDPGGPVIGARAVFFDNTEQVDALRQLSRRAEQQTLLQRLAREGLEGKEDREFLSVAVELVARGIGVEFGSILEVQPGDDALVMVATWGHSGLNDSAPVRISSALRTVEALGTADPVVTVDWFEDPTLEQSPWMVEAGVASSMAIGIRGPASPYGVLAVHSGAPRTFDGDDFRFMQLAGSIISVAIERKRSERQRRLLLTRLVNAQEAERRSIAEDIHDDAVQVMTAANMRLELFRMQLTDPAQLEAAEKLQHTVTLATGRLRSLLFELSPPALERYGIEAALRMHLQRFQEESGVECELNAELLREPMSQVRIVMFRIFQEALMNVRKHAGARHVRVHLRSRDQGVRMTVEDDGAGFSTSGMPEISPGHLGVASMMERAQMAGGWLRLQSEPGGGTEVALWIPCSEDATDDRPGTAEPAID